jgi:hypothetical protein
MFLFMALSYCHKQELKGTKLIIQHTMLDWRRSWAFCVGWSMLTSIAGRTPSSLWEDEKEKLTCGDSRSRRWYAPASGAMAVAQDESSSSDASGNVQICRSCPPSLAAQPSRSDEVVWEEEGKQDRASHGCSSTSRPAPPQAPPPPSAAPDPPPYPIAASRAPSPGFHGSPTKVNEDEPGPPGRAPAATPPGRHRGCLVLPRRSGSGETRDETAGEEKRRRERKADQIFWPYRDLGFTVPCERCVHEEKGRRLRGGALAA